jgi:tetraacyldisaccharide 4'-kinase
MRDPPFWWREAGYKAHLLAPFGGIYGAVVGHRLASRGARAAVPVVCIGNPTVGGAGKTPLALAVARMLTAASERPMLLSRGYGGALTGPITVDPSQHHAVDVGDEPLLLARAAPTIVARDRVAGASAAVTAGASVIVMDDGFQNPSLIKDFSVLVVDGRRGVGNGAVLPAGPLRASLTVQLDRAHAVVVVGAIVGAAPVVDAVRARRLPLFTARLAPDAGFIAGLWGQRVLAFAGIGDPEKMFATLAGAGVAVAAKRAFADHHRYTTAEARTLLDQADADGLVLVTTEKDVARLAGDAALSEFAARVRALPVTLMLDEEAGFRTLLLERIASARSTARATS